MTSVSEREVYSFCKSDFKAKIFLKRHNLELKEGAFHPSPWMK